MDSLALLLAATFNAGTVLAIAALGLLINERDKLVYDVDKRARLAWGDEPVNFR